MSLNCKFYIYRDAQFVFHERFLFCFAISQNFGLLTEEPLIYFPGWFSWKVLFYEYPS